MVVLKPERALASRGGLAKTQFAEPRGEFLT